MSTAIVVPELGESIHEARVARWLKQPGDRIAAGEAIVELETEKANLEVAATTGGVLARVAHAEGADVRVGDVLAVVESSAAAPPETDADRAAGSSTTATPTPGPAPTRQAKAPEPQPARAQSAKPKPVRTPTPEAKTARVQETAPATERVQAPVTPEPPPRRSGETGPDHRPVERVRLSKRRLTIARRLVEAQRTAAMLTTFNDVDMTRVLEVRRTEREGFEARHGVRLGIVSFFVRASVVALGEHPWLNAEMDGEEAILKRYYDIGIAVGAEEGLVVPVLRDADRMSFAQIEQGIRDLSSRAAARTLTLDDLRGGTFTITNGGVYGSLLSTPILNPPQVGILGLHRIEDRVRPVEGQVVIRPMMYLALSYDHRLVDGRGAVQFLARIKELIEDPGRLLLEA